MNEENSNVEGMNNEEWQAPPPPEHIEVEEKEQPQMSEVGTLANIFIEPGNTFKDLRRKPRFIMAAVIMAIIITAFSVTFMQRMGDERIRRGVMQTLEQNSQFAALSAEQKERQVNISLTIQKYSVYATPIIIFLFFLIGGLLYWLGIKAMGGSASFLQALSVWIYSSFPPTIVLMLANFVILFIKSPDDIDLAASQRGLVKANPTMFFDGKEMPVLATLISVLDVFVIWGVILAAIGLHIVGRISKGSAWGIVLIITLIGITFRVLGAFINGVPS